MTTVGPTLAYSHLNLRVNPFGEIERAERGGLAVVDLEPLRAALDRSRGAIQFVADCGHGKTTHLLALHRLFPDAPVVTVPRHGWVSFPAGLPLFLDEAQFVHPRRRRRLFRSRAQLVLGTHEDLRVELEDAGHDVVTIRPGAGLTPDTLQRVLRNRFEWARRAPGEVPSIPHQDVESLLARYGGNLRAIEAHLYEVFQRVEPGHHGNV